MPTISTILDIDYQIKEDEAVIRVHCKTKKGKKIFTDKSFLPYFYIIPKPGKKEPLKERIKKLAKENNLAIKEINEIRKQKNILQIISSIPPNIPHLKELAKSCPETQEVREYDIPFAKRYLISQNLCPLETYGILDNSESLKFKRTELMHENELPNLQFMAFDMESFNDEIIMTSFYSNSLKKIITSTKIENSPEYVESVKDEKELIKKTIEFLQTTDIVFGYNTDGFDFPLLKERALNHGLKKEAEKIIFQKKGTRNSVKVENIVHLDLYPFFVRIMGQEVRSSTFRLHDIANEFLGTGKEDLSWREIHAIWREKKNLHKLVEYAIKDAQITYDLGKRFFPLISSISKLTHILPSEACRSAYGTLVEQYLILKSQQNNLLVPNKPKTKDISMRRSTSYKGAFVLEPVQGRYESLAMFDYRSLYISILIAHNISPDTFKGTTKKSEIKDFHYEFYKEKQGFLPKILESIIKERGVLKKRLKTLEENSQEYNETNARVIALKYILNSAYGYLGYPNARWYCKECAESITFLGRHYIKETIREAEKQGFKVLYSDTDSILLQYKDKEKTLKFQEDINKKLPSHMELELEDFYKKGLFTFTKDGRGAKKRYALLSERGKIKIKGFEQVRRDWSPLAKSVQEKVIDLALQDKEKEAFKLITKTIQDLRGQKIPLERLGIYTRIRKNPKSYQTSIPHVAAAKRAILRGEIIERGQTIQYVITNKQGKISDKAEIIDFADSYDSQYYIENQILPAALRIMKIFGYKEEDFLEGNRQTGLKRFTTTSKT